MEMRGEYRRGGWGAALGYDAFMWPFRKPAKEIHQRREEFWKWFVNHERELFAFDGPNSTIVTEIGRAIKRVHAGLVWELGPEEDGKRAFVISADGIRAVFEEVEALADAAPPLDRFRIVRFRAPHPTVDFGLSVGELSIRIEEMEFVAQSGNSGLIDILLFMPGCPTPNDAQYAQAAFLMLDALLGEYNVACRLGAVDIVASDVETPDLERLPMTRLREMILER